MIASTQSRPIEHLQGQSLPKKAHIIGWPYTVYTAFHLGPLRTAMHLSCQRVFGIRPMYRRLWPVAAATMLLKIAELGSVAAKSWPSTIVAKSSTTIFVFARSSLRGSICCMTLVEMLRCGKFICPWIMCGIMQLTGTGTCLFEISWELCK